MFGRLLHTRRIKASEKRCLAEWKLNPQHPATISDSALFYPILPDFATIFPCVLRPIKSIRKWNQKLGDEHAAVAS